ncbi:MAG: YjjG family noncanonical pyrimidine nucleotidase [Lachnospiraceae bacterium]
MNQYDVILWDVDDTLLDFGMSERHAFQVTAERFGWHPGEAEYRLYSDINNRHWKMLECGLITMEQVKYLRFEALFRELHMDSVSIQDFQEHYQEELGNVFFIRDHSDEVMRQLRGICGQYLVTNGNAATQRHKLMLSGLDLLAEDLFISEELGYPKPDVRFFEEVFRRITQCGRERVLIVGDSLTSDMQGGRNVGIRTCYYNPQGAVNTAPEKCDYEIGTLAEVIDIVRGTSAAKTSAERG